MGGKEEYRREAQMNLCAWFLGAFNIQRFVPPMPCNSCVPTWMPLFVGYEVSTVQTGSAKSDS